MAQKHHQWRGSAIPCTGEGAVQSGSRRDGGVRAVIEGREDNFKAAVQAKAPTSSQERQLDDAF